MANEARVNSSLNIRKGNLEYITRPGSKTEDVNNVGGPTPGTLSVTTDGVDIDLSALTTPGLCEIENLDNTNWVELGIWEPDTSVFFPVLRFPPGKTYVFRISPNVGVEYDGTGTGTSSQNAGLRLKANGGTCLVNVLCFED